MQIVAKKLVARPYSTEDSHYVENVRRRKLTQSAVEPTCNENLLVESSEPEVLSIYRIQNDYAFANVSWL